MISGRKRAVGIANGYGMDGPGSKLFFLTRPDWLQDPPTQPPVQGTGSLSRGKSGQEVELTTHPIQCRS